MATTVKDLVLRFAQIVDPFTKAGVALTTSTIDDTDGDRFTVQRRLDIYNDARFALFAALRSMVSNEELTKAISGNVVDVYIEFTATYGNRYTYALPAGYVRAISIEGFAAGNAEKLLSIPILPATYLEAVKNGNPHFLQSATNKFVFEIGSSLIHFGSYLGAQQISGTMSALQTEVTVTGTSTKFLTECAVGAKLTLGAEEKTIATITSDTALTVSVAWSSDHLTVTGSVKNYHLKYFGITVYTTSDLAGSTNESFNTDYHPIIIELASAIANEQGSAEVNALAKSLLKMKGN